MKFRHNNRKCALYHIMLSSLELCEEIIETEQWKADNTVEAKLTFNGIEVDASILENKLHNWLESIEDDMKRKYCPEGIEKYIESEIERRIQEHADNAIEKLNELHNVLSNAAELIKPYYAR